MFSIEISKEDAKEFANNFSTKTKSRIKQGLALIRQEWQQEFRRQDASMQKVWTPLKRTAPGRSSDKDPHPRSYLARKRRDYYSGKSRGGSVKYLRILKRTGIMLEGYIDGIYISPIDMTVQIPFPDGMAGIRAKVHQGYDETGKRTRLPKGVLSTRPYDIGRFEMVANRILRREMYRI